VGALVLAWQDASVLVLAVLFGIAVTVFGVGQVAVGLRLRSGTQEPEATRRRWPRWLRLAGALGALVLALGAAAVSISIDRGREGEPGTFYAAPDPLPPGPPGTLIRSEVIDGYHPGATTYRVLYKTTGFDGAPTAASGLVLVPDRPAPTGGRTVVAYTHGTVGVESRCAPSLATPAVNPLFVEGGDELLDAGYVVAAPDYEGLGTRGPHPYLVGPSEAMSTLDAVRAARELAQAHAGPDIVVWGHSQGGHAALFTGQLASSYAPELQLKGVAAGAPVPDLVALFERNLTSPVGKVLIAMALASWSRVYDDAGLDRVLEVGSRRTVDRVSSICLDRPGQILGALPGALLLGFGFLSKPVWEVEPWKTIAAENTPGAAPIPAPLLVVQGTGDGVVFPDVTERFVQRLCRRGDTVSLRLYPGAGHVETSSLAVPDVVAWLADRVAGKPAATTCG
jgi:acetyl esterase/lipase